MDLTTTQILLRLLLFAAYFVLGILYFIYYMGMHNNTVDGNSYRLMIPFAAFDKSQFNEEGNRYRTKFNRVWLAGIVLLVLTALGWQNGW